MDPACATPPTFLLIPSQPARQRRAQLGKSGCDVALGRRLVLVEVELDLGAVWVVEEQLPDPASGKAAQLVFDPFALQCRDRPGQVSGAEGHVVEHAGAFLGQRIAMDHVQNRRVAIGSIEPPTRKLKGRPPTHPEAEEIAIEPPRRLEVVAQDGEMVHGGDSHRKNSFIAAINSSNPYSEPGCRVNVMPIWPERRNGR